MRRIFSASLRPLPRIDNSQKWRRQKFVFKSICARRRALCARRTTPLYRVERRVIAGFIQDASHAASRPAASSVGSSVHASSNCRSRWLTTRPSGGSPHCTQTTPHGSGKRRIYQIFNDTANAGPPAGPWGVRPGPLSRLVNLRGIGGSALWAKGGVTSLLL
jgi:hypothetical protein